QAARQAGFDPATARLMLHAQREQLTHAQHGLDRLQRIREALTQTPDTTVADREVIAQARARIDNIDLPGKQQLLDLLSVHAQAPASPPCPTGTGPGYQPTPPDYARHWPPISPSSHRLRVVPDITVHIDASELLVPHTAAESRSRAAPEQTTQTAG